MSTLADQIYRTMVQDIVAGRLIPGQRVEEQRVAERFGVSRTPVRDALKRLAGSGFIEFTPHCGASVKRPNVEQLGDMLEAQEEFEAICARLATQRMTTVERQQLNQIYLRQTIAIDNNDKSGYVALNDEFHYILHKGARNSTIIDMANNLHLRLKPFLPLMFSLNTTIDASLEEHSRIVKAVLACDADGAARAAREHATSANLRVMEVFRCELQAATETPLAAGGAFS